MTTHSRWFLGSAILGTALGLAFAGECRAFFPPPATGVSSGEVTPPAPPPVPLPPPDPFVPPVHTPPTVPPTQPPAVHRTPEPATLISAFVGLSVLGGYMLRKRKS
jgi:hypothetical protein